ncbi:glycosyltransferase family 2 protein [Pseudoclavibacter terrae]|uniref:Glycosyltransferase family 2 protein n=1 Tax=Pseudoclavibacter terrae TaxID=1530195 RepID=A0A7J5B780_9MICO|nr:glycosyltransferase family 2 protein [Pseudoclavibacter terrae]
MREPRFTVIIPTLQRSERLGALIDTCTRSPLVLEILVINNVQEPLTNYSSKLRIIQQDENIYVNPAWNLGARQARGDLLAIVNDDVSFDEEALEHAARVLDRGWFSVVGPDRSTFATASSRTIAHRLARHDATTWYFGTFMCLRTVDYVAIPEEMRIWGGDDWIIQSQNRPPAVLIRTRFETDMSTSSGSPEFRALRAEEQATADRILSPIFGTRWWHSPLVRVTHARIRMHRLSAWIRRYILRRAG